MSLISSARPPLGQPLRAHALRDAQLRIFDLALASLLLLAGLLPFLLLHRAGRFKHRMLLGRHELPFRLSQFEPAANALGQLAAALGLANYPVLIAILRGQLAFVGPRPLTPAEDKPDPGLRAARAAVRPGLTCTWWLRQRTLIDYGGEWQADSEYLQRRGIKRDPALLLRSLLASAYGRSQATPPQRVCIYGVTVHNLSQTEALDRMDAMLGEATPRSVCFVNPDCVNIAARDAAYRNAVAAAALALPDGIGMKIAGDLLATPIRQNVNGTDLFPHLCARLAASGKRLFLLGGRDGVAQNVAAWARTRYPALQIAGTHHGYIAEAELPALLEEIRASNTDMLLVAMGAPRQELFLKAHLAASGARLGMGVGGLFDFYSGRISRAPAWVREIGCEWVYRLLQEPGRMWRRYLVGNVLFLLRVGAQKFGLAHGPRPEIALRAPRSQAAAPATVETGAPGAGTRRPDRAVLIACTPESEWPAATSHEACLLPVGDRSLLQHAIENIVALGIRSIDLIACEDLASIRALVGDGSRWGASITVHLAKHPLRPYESLWLINSAHPSPLLIGHASRLVELTQLRKGLEQPTVFSAMRADGAISWSGWACVASGAICSRVRHEDFESLADRLASSADIRLHVQPGPILSAHSGHALLAAQHACLSGGFKPAQAPLAASQGLTIGEGCGIAATAQLIAPVVLGKGVFVGAGARIGPFAVLGDNTLVDADTEISDSLVLPGTYVGPGLKLQSAIAGESRIENVALGCQIPLAARDHIIHPTRTAPSGAWQAWTGRIIASALLVSVAPILVLLCFIRIRALAHAPIAQRDPNPCRAHLLGTLPRGLLDVVKGRRAWFGAMPRNARALMQIPGVWRAQIAAMKPGLLYQGLLLGVELDSPEAAAAADVFFAHAPAFKRKAQLLHRYAREVLGA